MDIDEAFDDKSLETLEKWLSSIVVRQVDEIDGDGMEVHAESANTKIDDSVQELEVAEIESAFIVELPLTSEIETLDVDGIEDADLSPYIEREAQRRRRPDLSKIVELMSSEPSCLTALFYRPAQLDCWGGFHGLPPDRIDDSTAK